MPIIILAVILLFIVASAFTPAEGGFFSRRGFAVGATTALAVPIIYSFFQSALPGSFPFDDSYISLTAARNLAEHFEFAVAPGRPLQGITSPLHILIVGLIGTATGVEIAARIVSLISFLFAAAGAGLFAERLTKDRRAFAMAAGMCVLSGPMLYDIGNGMETSLFTALVVWSFYLAEFAEENRKGALLTGAVIGLAMLARPEGLFAAAGALGVPAIRALIRRDGPGFRRRALSGAIALAVYSPFLLANFAYTGHFLPSTVSAKSIFFQHGMIFRPRPWSLVKPLILFMSTALILMPLALAGLAIGRRFSELASTAIFYLAYMVRFPDSLSHYRARYQHPLWPILAVGLTLLIFRVVRKTDSVKYLRRFAPAALTALMLLTVVDACLRYRQAFSSDTQLNVSVLLQTTMKAKSLTGEKDLIAAHDIGALHYFSGRRVLDIVGLTDRTVADSLARRNLGPEAISSILRRRRPNLLIVLRDWENDLLRITADAPPGRYELVWSSPMNTVTGAIYDIYKCRW